MPADVSMRPRSVPAGNARGVAFILDIQQAPVARAILSGGIPDVGVLLRGDFVKDTKDRSIDAEFVRAQLPTGDRPRPPATQPLDNQVGIQGGLFESWFSVSGQCVERGLCSPAGHSQSESTAYKSEERALGKRLTEQPPLASAQGGANREFACSTRGACN